MTFKEVCSECECKKATTDKISNALVGNGFCNDNTNVEACNFDGGDCCGTCVNSKYCEKCECKGENNGMNHLYSIDDEKYLSL